MTKVSFDRDIALREAAHQVSAAAKILAELWPQIDYFNEHGELPENKVQYVKSNVLDLSLAELYGRLNSLPSWISRNAKKIEKMQDGPLKLVKEQELEAKRAELQEVKDLFNNANARIILD